MWSFSIQPGFATALVDFTNDLSLLTVGLLGLLALSAGMIAVTAVRHYLAEKVQPAVETAPSLPDYRKAA
ncbi:MAG TPA: hypothetical protein VKJ47_22300 [Candidatus Binatia bacterium]|nr:hypothetical protein [Candidatus Binatia bacterium]